MRNLRVRVKYSEEAMQEAVNVEKKLERFLGEKCGEIVDLGLEEIKRFRTSRGRIHRAFVEFNTPKILLELQKIVEDGGGCILQSKKRYVRRILGILGVVVSDGEQGNGNGERDMIIERTLKFREKIRKLGIDILKESDSFRDKEMKEIGIFIEDSKENGFRWKYKKCY